MKVIRTQGEKRSGKVNFTVRLTEETLKKIDKIAHEEDFSRQKLVEAILEQALNDKDFVLRVN